MLESSLPPNISGQPTNFFVLARNECGLFWTLTRYKPTPAKSYITNGTRSPRFHLKAVPSVSSNARDVNKAFAAYVQASESERSQREQEFERALRQCGSAIVWLTLRRQSPEIVDAGIDTALRHYRAFKGKSKFSTWYWQIVKRLCWAELRKKARSKEVLFSDLDPRKWSSSPHRCLTAMPGLRWSG